MGLQIKKKSSGSGYRPTWYIRYRNERKQYVSENSGIPIAGTPPASLALKDTGDAAFERSRAKAEAFLENFLRERKIKGAAEEITKSLIEAKTGRKITYARIDGLYESWLNFSRVRDVTDERKTINKAIFKRFANHLMSTPQTRSWQYLYEVTPEAAKSFIDSLKTTLTASTLRDYRTLLSGAFKRLLPSGIQNPFADIKVGDGSADSAKIHRKPLTDEQLQKLFDTARKSDDPWLLPVTICAAETGLRIGDVCKLKWQDIYLDEGRISVLTSKTGERVDLPIFPELRKVFEARIVEKSPSDKFVFPDAASMYLHNKTGIRTRGKRLFAEALFGNVKTGEKPTEVVNGIPKPPMTEAEVLASIDNSKFIAKKKSLAKDIYSRYIHGQTYTQISRDLRILRSRICTLLKNIEELTGEKIRPWAKADEKQLHLRLTRQEHEIGKNAVSIYGWHSLRATFCVRASLRGVPPELIKAAVGHKTFDTTQKYYLHPTWEMFRAAWNGMSRPRMIPGESAPTISSTIAPALEIETAKRILATLTPEQAQAVQLLGGLLKAS